MFSVLLCRFLCHTSIASPAGSGSGAAANPVSCQKEALSSGRHHQEVRIPSWHGERGVTSGSGRQRSMSIPFVSQKATCGVENQGGTSRSILVPMYPYESESAPSSFEIREWSQAHDVDGQEGLKPGTLRKMPLCTTK
jgi:hypothetical protein